MREHRFFVSGEIDLAEASHLRDELLATIRRSKGNLALDFSDVTFLDCAGIRVLMEVASLLRSRGRPFRFVHVARTPRRPLEVLGLTEVLHVEGGPQPQTEPLPTGAVRGAR